MKDVRRLSVRERKEVRYERGRKRCGLMESTAKRVGRLNLRKAGGENGLWNHPKERREERGGGERRGSQDLCCEALKALWGGKFLKKGKRVVFAGGKAPKGFLASPGGKSRLGILEKKAPFAEEAPKGEKGGTGALISRGELATRLGRKGEEKSIRKTLSAHREACNRHERRRHYA